MDNILIGKRLKSARENRRLTLSELGQLVGVAASTVQRYESGLIIHPKTPVLTAFAAALGVEKEWLLCESEDAERPADMPNNAFSVDPADMISVPVIGRVAAGLACHAENNIESYELIPQDSVKYGSDYVFLRVTGDSMSPMIMEDDLVLVRCQDIVDSGTYAVVIIDDEDGVVKKVVMEKNRIKLISENPYYPPRIFEGPEVSRIRIFGKVTEIKRKLP